MNITVSVNAAAPLTMLRNGHKRAGYAIVNALNETGETIQDVMRGRVLSQFQVRKTGFLINQVKLFRASVAKGRFEVRVGIGIGKGLQGSPLLLPGFEAGAERKPAKGARVAIPVSARAAKPQSIPENLWIQRLQLKRVRAAGRRRKGASSGVVVRKGLQHTFQIPGVGVIQRVASTVTRLLYLFVRPFRLDRRLEFYRTAHRVVDRDFASNLRSEVRKTFAFQLRRAA